MNKSGILEAAGNFGMNLYDMAVIDENGTEEKQFQPCNNCNNGFSVTKAFTMTAVGLLQDDGLLSVSDPVTRFFPSLPSGADAGWNRVTLEHLLTHTVGFAEGFLDTDDDNLRFIAEDRDPDYLKLIWQQKLAYEPGTRYAYSDTAFYLLSRVVSQVSGLPLDEFLRTRLINPLKFGSIAWSRCPMGYPMGATGMFAAARDVAKLGELYLQGGTFRGTRLLSEAWVRQTLEKGYELKPVDGTRFYGKRGMYGQMVLFDPEKKFAMAWHAHMPSRSDAAFVRWLSENA